MTTRPEAPADLPVGPLPAAVWLLWDCADLVGVFATETEARTAQADLQFTLLCIVGCDIDLLETITVTKAPLHTEFPRVCRRVAR